LSRRPQRVSSPIGRTFCTPPKVRSQKTASLCRANDEAGPAQTSVPSCADARDQPCRLLHAALLPLARLPHNARATLHSYSIEPYARATHNLREGLNQADRMAGISE